ncbi:PP2C family protein-serine/threonine phosphatase [Yinghuangia soli]|uniref:Protein phosphatase 2C domain-containing protein n=1 Tax=Yinghuangia soli TaxID=2908204 RepID=A0AA41TWT7_9ACTN|nr:protein phosphatase 2C domain-containing protein [Yinghuangia soli]MCF2526168.1 protein phosphatase 2C domain-containing protein [Yinghuangia soli]
MGVGVGRTTPHETDPGAGARSGSPTTVVHSCPSCGVAPQPGYNFCEACGYDLRTAPPPPVAERAPRRGEFAAAVCRSCRTASIGADGWCESCGRAYNPRDSVVADLRIAAGVSDRGLRHRRNEDAMAVEIVDGPHGPSVVAVVCDGVSSSPRPDDASATATRSAGAALAAALRGGAGPEAATRAAAAAAASAVARLAGPGEADGNAPACTYVSAVVTPDTVTIGWVGDSRAYWLSVDDHPVGDQDTTIPARSGAAHPAPEPDHEPVRIALPGSPLPAAPEGLAPDDTMRLPTPSALLTEDDSWAARMVACGQMTEAQAYADSRAHAIVSWLGADAGEVRARVMTLRPNTPGAVLLCSDGLWNYVQAAQTLSAFALPYGLAQPVRAARALTDYALQSGGADNITVVLVPFPPAAHAGPEPKE